MVRRRLVSALAALLPAAASGLGPLPRTAAIVGVEMACGDAIEQRLERCERWDRLRSARLGATGLVTTGPLAHMLFQQLERQFPRVSLKTVLQKVAANAMFMPVMIGATLSTAWALEGRGLQQIRRSLQDELLPTFAAGLLFWPAVNIFIFAAVPPPMRPAISSGFGGVWGVVLSARANAAEQ